MKKHSKMYVEALGNVEKNKEYNVTEAIKVLKGLKTRKFDESVDLALKLNIDAKKTDQISEEVLFFQMELVRLKEY